MQEIPNKMAILLSISPPSWDPAPPFWAVVQVFSGFFPGSPLQEGPEPDTISGARAWTRPEV